MTKFISRSSSMEFGISWGYMTWNDSQYYKLQYINF